MVGGLAVALVAAAGPIQKSLGSCKVWTVMPTPALLGASLAAVDAAASDDVWAVGEYGGTYGIVDHWDGVAWTMTTQQGINNSLSAVVAISSTDVWASGYRIGHDGVPVAFTEHWDGNTWTPMPTPHPGFESRALALAAFSTADVWAAGYYLQSDILHPLYLHWDGTSWTQFPSPSSGGTVVNALAGVSSDDLWALGQQAAPQPYSTRPLAEHWDGSSWTAVKPAPVLGGGDRDFDGGVGVASVGVWAVGSGEYSGPGGTLGSVIQHWDGVEWRTVRNPNGGKLLAASMAAATDVWVVGVYVHLADSHATSEHWDGTRWAALLTPNPEGNSQLNGVKAITGTDIWAVGEYVDQVGGLEPLSMHSSGIC